MGYLMTDNPTASQQMLNEAFQQLGDYQAACKLVGVPSQTPDDKKREKVSLLADEIRSLFIRAAKGDDIETGVKQVRQRAAEAGKTEVYLYWKR
jgi:hypothetical protein